MQSKRMVYFYSSTVFVLHFFYIYSAEIKRDAFWSNTLQLILGDMQMSETAVVVEQGLNNGLGAWIVEGGEGYAPLVFPKDGTICCPTLLFKNRDFGEILSIDWIIGLIKSGSGACAEVLVKLN